MATRTALVDLPAERALGGEERVTGQQIGRALAFLATFPPGVENDPTALRRIGRFAELEGPDRCLAPVGSPDFWETVPIVKLDLGTVRLGACQFHLGRGHLERAIISPHQTDYEPGAYSYPECALVEGMVWIRDGHHRIAADLLLGRRTAFVRLYDQDRYGPELSRPRKTRMNWASDTIATPMLEPPEGVPGVTTANSARVVDQRLARRDDNGVSSASDLPSFRISRLATDFRPVADRYAAYLDESGREAIRLVLAHIETLPAESPRREYYEAIFAALRALPDMATTAGLTVLRESIADFQRFENQRAGEELADVHGGGSGAVVLASEHPPLPPGVIRATDRDGYEVLRNAPGAKPHYGPTMTQAEAEAAGWEGPYYHGTSSLHRARSIIGRGFRQPHMPNFDLANPGTAEDVEKGNSHQTYMTRDLDEARRYAGADGHVVTVYAHPEHLSRDWDHPLYRDVPVATVRDVRHVAPITDAKLVAGYDPDSDDRHEAALAPIEAAEELPPVAEVMRRRFRENMHPIVREKYDSVSPEEQEDFRKSLRLVPHEPATAWRGYQVHLPEEHHHRLVQQLQDGDHEAAWQTIQDASASRGHPGVGTWWSPEHPGDNGVARRSSEHYVPTGWDPTQWRRHPAIESNPVGVLLKGKVDPSNRRPGVAGMQWPDDEPVDIDEVHISHPEDLSRPPDLYDNPYGLHKLDVRPRTVRMSPQPRTASLAPVEAAVHVPADFAPPGAEPRDLRHPEATIRGRKVITPDELPEHLYHATTALDAVRESGHLRAGGVGGLGGDKRDRIVSMTTDPQIAHEVAGHLRDAATWAREYPDTERGSDERAQANHELVRKMKDRARQDGWDFTDGDAILSAPGMAHNSEMSDLLAPYHWQRRSKTGRPNPIIMTDHRGLREIDPDQVGVVKVHRDDLRNGALLVDFDRGQGSLEEVRSYGDVPLRDRQPHQAALEPVQAALPPLSWDDIAERWPGAYGDLEGEHRHVVDEAHQLAHSTPDDPDGERYYPQEMQFHREEVDPRHIDHKTPDETRERVRPGDDEARIARAEHGYRNNPEKVPPLVLVHRHNVYYPADGNHRAIGAKRAGTKVRAYVAYSPHPDTPFGTSEMAEYEPSTGPFFGAEPHPGQRHEAALVPAVAAFSIMQPEEYSRLRLDDHEGASLSQVRERLSKESPSYYRELREHIQQNGVRTPILLEGDKVMDGHNRLAIAHEFGLSVPVGDYSNPEHYDASVLAPLSREWADRRRSLGETRREAVAAHPISWQEITERHPDTYGVEYYDDAEEDPHGAGEEIAQAAGELAFDRPGESSEDGAWHHAHDLDWHEETVHPRHIDYSPREPGDSRVESAKQGYRQHPEAMPPPVLVHRHGVYQVADGHHRSQAAHELNMPIKAYVAYSPHPDEPFSAATDYDEHQERKAPFHNAEPHPGVPEHRGMVRHASTEAEGEAEEDPRHLLERHGFVLHPSDDEFEDYGRGMEGWHAETPVKWLDPQTPVHTTQWHLHEKALDHYLRHPSPGPSFRGGPEQDAARGHLHHPETVTYEGQVWAADGHHRILSHRMRGKPIQVYNWDLDREYAGLEQDHDSPLPGKGERKEAAVRHEPIRHIIENYTFDDGPDWASVKESYDLDHPSWNDFREDVRRNGVQKPISIDYDQDPPRVVDGHTRLMLAEQVGHSHIPVVNRSFHDAHPWVNGEQTDADDPDGSWRRRHSALEPAEAAEDEYRMQHQPNNAGPLHDLLHTHEGDDLVPGDFYDHMHDYYGDGGPHDAESRAAIWSVKGKPKRSVTIYRAVPKDVHEINHGDWITLSRSYAREHAQDLEGAGRHGKVIQKKVPAEHVGWDGNSINEFGYFGPGVKSPRRKPKPEFDFVHMEARTPDGRHDPDGQHSMTAYDKAGDYVAHADYRTGRRGIKVELHGDDSAHEHLKAEIQRHHPLSVFDEPLPWEKQAVAEPTTIQYIRSTEKLPGGTEGFGRDVEPRGRYLNEHAGANPDPERWETGEVTFRNPLHLPFGGGYDEDSNWKRELSRRFEGKTGRDLSDAVVAAGHDGIVTHDEYGTSEIVDLTGLRPREAATDVPRFTLRYQTQGTEGYEDREREVEGPFYHGSRSKRIKPGDTIRPGFKTNSWGDEGERSQRVHFTTDHGAAQQYAEQAGGHVYEVEPTGEVQLGYGGGEYKSAHPLRVIRRVEHHELEPRQAGAEPPRAMRAYEVYEREREGRELAGITPSLSGSQAAQMFHQVLKAEGHPNLPHERDAHRLYNRSENPNHSMLVHTEGGYPALMAGDNMLDPWTVLHEAAHEVRNGGRSNEELGFHSADHSHDQEWVDTFQRLVKKHSPVRAMHQQVPRVFAPDFEPAHPSRPDWREVSYDQARQAVLVGQPVERTFQHREEETGGTKWPAKHYLTAHAPGGTELGVLDYYTSKTQRKILIGNIQSRVERQGHASALMDELLRRHPDASIQHEFAGGDGRTTKGKDWWNSYVDGRPVKKGRPIGDRPVKAKQAAVRSLPTSEVGPLYHGTTRARANQILSTGFEGSSDRQGTVHLTPHPDLAHEYAKGRVLADGGGDPVVLKVDSVRGVSASEVGYMDYAKAREAGAHYADKGPEVVVLDPGAISGVSLHRDELERKQASSHLADGLQSWIGSPTDVQRHAQELLAGAPVRDTDPIGVYEQRAQAREILRAVGEAPASSAVLHRGATVAHAPQEGQNVLMPLVGFSTRQKTAEGFARRGAGNVPVVYHLAPGAKALRVAEHVSDTGEGEHIVGGQFQVDRVEGPDANGLHHAHIRQEHSVGAAGLPEDPPFEPDIRSIPGARPAFGAAQPEMLHRGVTVEVDPDELLEAHTRGGMPAVHQHIAETALHHPKGIGTHWSRDPVVAQHFAHGPISSWEEGPRTAIPYANTMHVPVVIHGRVAPEHHETDPEKLRDAMVIGHGFSYGEGSKLNHEDEVLVRPGAPVHVTHVEAALPSDPGWMDKLDDGRWDDGDGPRWRDQEHGWHQVAGEGRHTAAIVPVEAASQECEYCGEDHPTDDHGAYDEETECDWCGSLSHTRAEHANSFRTENWDEVWPHVGDLHRGINVYIPGPKSHPVHDQSRPIHERAQALVEHLSQRPHGMHWTEDPDQAENYATVAGPNRGTPVRITVHKPDRQWVEEDDDTLRDNDVIGYGQGHEDAEIPLREGAPLRVKSISWGDDGSDRLTHHHTFGEFQVQHHASSDAQECNLCEGWHRTEDCELNEDTDPYVTDWSEHWDSLPEHLHRGMNIHLPGAATHPAHDASRPIHERARALADHLAQRPMGMHWTTNSEVADAFASAGDDHPVRRGTAVRVTIHKPHRDHVETDPAYLRDAESYGYDSGQGEQEVPLREDAPLKIHSIHWSDYGSHELTNHHVFDTPAQHHAAVEVEAASEEDDDWGDDFPDEEEDEETASARRTDWDEVYATLPEHLHRGAHLHLPEHVHQVVHDASRPEHERARALVEHLQQGQEDEFGESGGLGMHWTGDRKIAGRYATDYALARHGTPVVVSVHKPDRDWIEEDPDALREGDVIGHGRQSPSELFHDTEVPISHGAPLAVHSVSWGDHGSMSLQHHHTFAAPIQHHASAPEIEHREEPAGVEGYTSKHTLVRHVDGQPAAAIRYYLDHGGQPTVDLQRGPSEHVGPLVDELRRRHPGGWSIRTRPIDKGPRATPAPAPQPHHEVEDIDDETYSVHDVDRANAEGGLDTASELEGHKRHPRRAEFRLQRVPIDSLRIHRVDDAGRVVKGKPFTSEEMEAQDEPEEGEEDFGGSERERLDSIRQADDGALPPVLLVKHGDDHLILDGSHRVGVAMERGETHVPAFVTDHEEPERKQAAADEAAQVSPWFKADTDWSQHAELPPIHRGVKIWPDLHPGFDEVPDHEMARHIIDHIAGHRRGGLGVSWTDDVGHAQRAATSGQWMGDRHHPDYVDYGLAHQPGGAPEGPALPVILHAEPPEHEHVERDPARLRENNVSSYDNDDEGEIPLRHDAPVRVTGVSWQRRPANPGSWAEWRHHQFPEPVEVHGGAVRGGDVTGVTRDWPESLSSGGAAIFARGEDPTEHEQARQRRREEIERQFPPSDEENERRDREAQRSEELRRIRHQIIHGEQPKQAAAEQERPEHPDYGSQYSRPDNEWTAKYLAGTLKHFKYPDEVETTLYHGTKADLAPGDWVEPGHPGNFVKRMKHVYATEDLDSAVHYSYGGQGSRPHVYEVAPSGPIGHRRDARGAEWASAHPMRVVREVPHPFYDKQSHEAAAEVEEARPPGVPITHAQPEDEKGLTWRGVVHSSAPLVYRSVGDLSELHDAWRDGRWSSRGEFVVPSHEGQTQFTSDRDAAMKWDHPLRKTRGNPVIVEADISGLPARFIASDSERNWHHDGRGAGTYHPSTSLGIGVDGGVPVHRIRRAWTRSGHEFSHDDLRALVEGDEARFRAGGGGKVSEPDPLGRRPKQAAAEQPAPARRGTNDHIDWDYELGKMKKGVHRGMRVALPPEVHDFVHDRMQTPSRQAQAIVEHLRSSGVGLHWSPDAKIATDFAVGGKQAGDWNGPKKGETSIVLHAETPHPEHIATTDEIDEARAAGHNFEPYDGWIGGPLKEIPLSPEAPVKITGVTWYQGPRRRKVYGDVWSAEDPRAGQPRPSKYDAASDHGETALDEERRPRPAQEAQHTAGRVAEPIQATAVNWTDDWRRSFLPEPHKSKIGEYSPEERERVFQQHAPAPDAWRSDPRLEKISPAHREAMEDLPEAQRWRMLRIHGPHPTEAPPEAEPEWTAKDRYYHGTVAPRLKTVQPANVHGKGVVFHSETDPDHAYATEDPDDAWRYAEWAHNAHVNDVMHGRKPAGKAFPVPRVYEVEPVNRDSVEQDPLTRLYGDREQSRNNNAGDVRSPHGFRVLRELPMPEHMGTPNDWRH